MAKKQKVIVTGAGGLVGQNLMFELENYDVTAISKSAESLAVLKSHHPNVSVIAADLAESGDWEKSFKGADVLITLHAQIAAKNKEPFVRNNIIATQKVLAAAKKYKIPYIVHISSSVVISVAKDDYTDTKREQEELVKNSGIPYTVLRPPLMFGWFDDKHLGWISRFMKTWKVFPVPGDGKFLRQPLFVSDFCKVIAACVKMKPKNKAYDIIGAENVTYIDIIRKIKAVLGLHTWIICIPMPIFAVLMKIYSLISPSFIFTNDQLKALTAGDKFPVWDWQKFFKVKQTPFDKALEITHKGKYSGIILKQ